MNWSAVIFLALAIGAHGDSGAELEDVEARQEQNATSTSTTSTVTTNTTTENSTLTSTLSTTGGSVSNSTGETTLTTGTPTTDSNVTITTSIPTTTSPPRSLDQQCRNNFAFLSLFATVSFYNNTSGEPCRIYCQILRLFGFLPAFVLSFPVKDMTPCGNNKECQCSKCVERFSQDEIKSCQDKSPGSNVTAKLDCFNQCHVACYEGNRCFSTVNRTDGVSCQRLFTTGKCRGGFCQWAK